MVRTMLHSLRINLGEFPEILNSNYVCKSGRDTATLKMNRILVGSEAFSRKSIFLSTDDVHVYHFDPIKGPIYTTLVYKQSIDKI